MNLARTLTTTLVTISLLALPGGPGTGAASAAPTPPAGTATPDFDGDGNVDLATAFMGVWEDTRITVRYGSGATALITAQRTILDEWGHVGDPLAHDLNSDGYSDLAFVGIGLESGTSLCELFGSPAGLQLTSLHCAPVPGASAPYSVATLGFVEAPVPRLVIGVTSRADEGGSFGHLLVYSLGPDGLPRTAPAAIAPGSGPVPDLADAGSFGSALAGTGSRLFVGAPRAKVGPVAGAGAVVSLSFAADGIVAGELITQNTPGVAGSPAKGDDFGASLAARDGHLAVGAPGDQVGNIADVGSVQLLSLSEDGQTPTRWLTQATNGVPGKPESGDHFGAAVAIGMVCDGVIGVVVGGPGEVITNGHDDDGSAWIVPLSSSADCPAQQLWEGNGLSGEPTYWRRLGEHVAVIRDGAESTDRIAVAGEGLVSDQSPIGVLTVWSTRDGLGLLHIEECIRGVAGR